MNESRELQECIRNVIKTYRSDRGFFGGSGLTDRDQRALVGRLSESIRDRLAEIDRTEVEELYDEIESLEEEVRLSSGSQYGELRQEYEAVKALAKHLIFRLGEEENAVRVSLDTLHDMEERVQMNIEDNDGEIVIRVTEYD